MTTRLARRLLAVCCCLLLGLGPAAASTTHIFGTIVAVDLDGGSFTILVDFFNYLRGRGVEHELGHKQVRITDDITFLLDGERSTAAEALAVGRAITLHNDEQAFVSTTSGPDHVTGPVDLDHCLLRLLLPKAVTLPVLVSDKRRKREPATVQSTLIVLAECRAGQVVAATAFAPPDGKVDFGSAGSFAVDASKITLSDGHLTGELGVRLAPSSDWEGVELTDGQQAVAATYRLDVQVDAQGSVSGSFTGTLAEQSVQGDVNGAGRSAPEAPAAGRMWLRVYGGGMRDKLVVPVVDGNGGPGLVIYQKGDSQNGTVDQNSLSITGNALAGSLAGTYKGKPFQLRFEEGVLVGNRHIGGRCLLTIADGEPVAVSVRGSLLALAGPPLRGCYHKQPIEDVPWPGR